MFPEADTRQLLRKEDYLSSVGFVEAHLVDLLQEPGISAGARLPTERAIAQELDVSRSIVRRAFAKLEAQGKVVRLMGSGTYVAETEAPGSVEPASLKDYSPREIMQARLIFEPRFANLIVMNANGADIEQLGVAMVGAEKADSFEQFEYWDGQFHQVLANGTHNQLIIDIYQVITHSRDAVEWGELKRHSLNHERRLKYQTEHRSIYDALHGRNAQRAELEIRTHLLSVQENLFGF